MARRVARMEGDVRECRRAQFEMEGKMARLETWMHGSMDAVLRKLDTVLAGQQRTWVPPPGQWCWPQQRTLFQPSLPATLLEAAERGDAEGLLRLLAMEGGSGRAGDVEQRDAKGNTPLHCAATRGDIRCTSLLLTAGARVHAPGNRLRAPLHLAATRGQHAVARLLLDAGAEVDARDADGATPLALAAQGGTTQSFGCNAQTAALLLERGARVDAADDKGQTPAFRAAAHGHEDVLLLLLDRGANLEATSADGESLVAHAARSGQWGAVKLLLAKGASTRAGAGADADAGADAGAGGDAGAGAGTKRKAEKSALVLAARAGEAGAVRELLQQQQQQRRRDGSVSGTVDEEQVEEALNAAGTAGVVWALAEAAPAAVRGEPGKWALLYAAEEGRLEALQALLEAGVDAASARDAAGISALHAAAWNGHFDCLRALLRRGKADVTWRDANGDTALHKAALADRQWCVRALLEAAGVAVDDVVQLKNKQGETPRDLAASEVVRRMLDGGVAAAVAEYALSGGRKFTFGIPSPSPFGTPATSGTLFGTAPASGPSNAAFGLASSDVPNAGNSFGMANQAATGLFGSAAANGATFGSHAGTGAGATFGSPAGAGATFGSPAGAGATFGSPAGGGTTFGAPPSGGTVFGAQAVGGTTFGASAGCSPSKTPSFGAVGQPRNTAFGFASSDVPNQGHTLNTAFDSSFGGSGGNNVSAGQAFGTGNQQLNCGYTFGIPGGNVVNNVSGVGYQPANGPFGASPQNAASGNSVFGNIAQPSHNGGNAGAGSIFGASGQSPTMVFRHSVLEHRLSGPKSIGSAAQNTGPASALFGAAQQSTRSIFGTPVTSSSGGTNSVFNNATENANKVSSIFGKVGPTDNKVYCISSGNPAKNTGTNTGKIDPSNNIPNGSISKQSLAEEGKDGAARESSTSTNDSQ